MPELSSIRSDQLFFHHSVDETEKSDLYDLHCHATYEIFYLIRGSVSYRVEGREYTPAPGSVLLLRPGVFHGRRHEGGTYERCALHFSPSILNEDYRQRLLAPFDDAENGCYYTDAAKLGVEQGISLLCLASEFSEPQKGLMTHFAVQALLTSVLQLRENSASAQPAAIPDTVTELLWYLNQDIAAPVRLDDLAAKFFISKHHMNKLFRAATGTTVLEYVIRKRVTLTQALMLEGYPAAEAAERAGFGDYSNFYRAYRRITGHAPSTDKPAPDQLLLEGQTSLLDR